MFKLLFKYPSIRCHARWLETAAELPVEVKNLLLASSVATEDDLICIEQRQLNLPVPDVVAVDNDKCRYGYPQAFAQHPFTHKGVRTGNLRLTCPHLVKKIDEMEKDGAIALVNDSVAVDDNLKDSFNSINDAWEQFRKVLLSKEDIRRMEWIKGEKTTAHMLESGIIGVTKGKVDDVKCLHAHVADALLRGREHNPFGRDVLERIDAEEGQGSSGCKGE